MNKKIAVFMVGALICVDSANSQNLVENQVNFAESALDSANQKNPSLRADSQNLRGNPPCKKSQNLQRGWLLCDARKFYELPRSHSLARNDEILDSSLRATRYAQNDNLMKIAESSLDSANQSEFIISYRAIMKNNALIGEKFSVSKALSITPNPHIKATCDIESSALTNALDSNLAILKQNQNAILECFERELSTKIRDDVKSINNEVRTKTTYKIPAQRILLDRQRLKIHIIGQK